MANNTTLPSPPFTVEQLEANKRAQRMLHDLLPMLDKADKCGIDTSGLRAIAAGLQAQLQAIHQEFLQHVGKSN